MNLLYTLLIAFAFVAEIPLEICQAQTPWHPPTLFEGCADEKGGMFVSKEIAQIDLGANEILPVVIQFNPVSRRDECGLGPGWNIALLNSHMVQIDEDRFQLYQPDGEVRDFLRSTVDSSRLVNPEGWSVVLRGNSLTVDSPQNWRLVYQQGALHSIRTPLGKELVVARASDEDRIDLQGKTVLRLPKGPRDKVRSLIEIANDSIEIQFGIRPLMRPSGVGAILESLVPSVSKVSTVGRETTFDFNSESDVVQALTCGETRGEYTQPSITYRWDSTSGRVLSSGGKAVSQAVHPDGSIEMLAVNADGTSNAYSCNSRTSTREVKDVDGGVTTYYAFSGSDKLAGKLRKITVRRGKEEKLVYRAHYNEDGLILKEEGLINGFHTKTDYIYDADKLSFSKRHYIGDTLDFEETYRNHMLFRRDTPLVRVVYDALGMHILAKNQ